MFSSEDVAKSIEDIAHNESWVRLKNRLPRMKEQDIDASFQYAFNHHNTEMLNVLVQNAPNLSDQQKQQALMLFVGLFDVGKITSFFVSHPNTDANEAILFAGKTENFNAIKVLVDYASPQSIDRVFECCMENHTFGIVEFLIPYISEDGDHVNSLIYASDADRQDLFDLLYTTDRAQQAFENIKLLVSDIFSDGYNIKPIKDRLDAELQNQRIHAQLDTKTFCPLPRKL